jgi:hypothetical protein
VDRLALQGLNVVIVAMEDTLLTDSVKELQKAFPKQQVPALNVMGLGDHCLP